MSKKSFDNLIRENQRLNRINPRMVHLLNQSVEEEKTNKKNNKNNKNLKKMKNNKQTVFMAIAKGRETAEPTEIKRYIGIASCNIVAINPNKATIDMLYGRESEKEPNYLGETEINGVKLPQARIDVYFKLADKYLDDKGNPLHTIFRKSIFLSKTSQSNRESTKIKVVDEFGNTAWVTNEQAANHEIPMYSNGPASIMKDYRPLYRNEEIIMNIVKTFLRIVTIRVDANQNPMKYNGATKQWEITNDASDGLIRFDTTEKFFSGDFKEIQDVPSYQPKNLVKILLGVRNVDGKMYQDVFDTVLSNNTTDYSRLEKELNDAKANGRYADTEFRICEFQEYNVTPTNFSNNTAHVADPFANAEDIF